ncbi:MAG: N-acetylglutaminylglutamine amidotransferase, partial [Gammaproteobacteria bacterium]|nr:N-acetylglutaminylglutamine amidotransferase [Gammaproteobacteria bacterium]
MCGLVGEFRFDGTQPVLKNVLSAMTALERRGPDSGGHWLEGPLAFGHRRLSVIDLSDQANQPMVDEKLGLALVFNGAIYNYRELRAQLIDLGYEFFSHGDTEVILKA